VYLAKNAPKGQAESYKFLRAGGKPCQISALGYRHGRIFFSPKRKRMPLPSGGLPETTRFAGGAFIACNCVITPGFSVVKVIEGRGSNPINYLDYEAWISQAWQSVGGCRIVDIRLVDIHRVGAYLSKYLTKDLLLSAPACKKADQLLAGYQTL
jgi:hypothetical protein